MNLPRFERAVADLRRRLAVPPVEAAVLFGSAARGEAGEESDLDLLIVHRAGADPEAVLAPVREVEYDHKVRIGTLVADPGLQGVERQLLDSILREGVVLVGAMPRLDVRELDLLPVRLVTVDLRGLPHRRKMQLAREIFGYSTRKRYKRKVYLHRRPGRIEAWGGRRLGRGVFLVPERHRAEVDRLLRSYGAKRLMIPMWIQSP